MSVNRYDPATDTLIPVSGTNNHLKDEMVAEYESTSTATHAYEVGGQFIYNGKLYEATSAISIGSTIITEGVNTNCVESDSLTEQIAKKGSADNFIGTKQQWEVLTPEEQAKYKTMDFIGDGGGSSGGHTILNESGTEMPQRSKLQFEGCEVTDDSTNGITKIKAEGSVTGIKGNAESTYRTGDVNLTHADLGMDTTPTANSTNPVTSGALKTALDGKVGTSGASTNTTVAFTSNDLAANTTVKTNTTTNQPSTVAKLSSGETLASMFGKISSMFASIRKLWNTVGSTAIDTAYGATLTAQMANLKSYNTYSTSETWTGKYWIDGKKIYQKVYINSSGLPSDGAALASDIDKTISVCGNCRYNTAAWLAFPYHTTTEHWTYETNIANNTIVAKITNGSSSIKETYITLEYTKTT